MTKEEFTLKDLPGVGPATVEKLQEAGYDTLLSVAVASIGQLTNAVGIGEGVARKMIQTARAKLDMGFETGTDLLEKRKSIVKITSGSPSFDNLLGGGFETGCITECFGAYGSSKTQLANSLAVRVQLPKEQGGAEGIAVFIDTEGTFRPERIKQIAESKGINPENVLKNILTVFLSKIFGKPIGVFISSFLAGRDKGILGNYFF
jgi:DNA repair protein RadA